MYNQKIQLLAVVERTLLARKHCRTFRKDQGWRLSIREEMRSGAVAPNTKSQAGRQERLSYSGYGTYSGFCNW